MKYDLGEYRFCVDFCPLNTITIHDVFPMPRIDDLLDLLGGSSYFTSLDLASGYWQIPIAQNDRPKTMFPMSRVTLSSL